MDEKELCGKYSPPKLPPKSRFNDEESTAVLRLLLKQEKLLSDKNDNPALTITPAHKAFKHLPPVLQDHEEFNGERGMIRDDILPVASHQGGSILLPCLDAVPFRGAVIDYESGTPEGIFRSAKLARAKERPKESYGRRQPPPPQQHQPQQLLQQQHQHHQQQQNLRRNHSEQETQSKWKEKCARNNVLLRTQSCPDSDQLSKYSPQHHKKQNLCNSNSRLTDLLSQNNHDRSRRQFGKDN